MLLMGKQLSEISVEDLQRLVENKVLEKKTLEYKQELPGSSDAQKKKFLAEVSSFANAAGGHIIFGIAEKEEQDETTLDLCGLGSVNTDSEILRLENSIRDGIRPRILGIATEPIRLEGEDVAIIIEVPRSWSSPHRVTFSGHDKFYTRDSAGKHSMDVDELRAAFLLSDTIAERLRNFRVERLSRIIGGETPVALPDGPKIVLHIVPFAAFQPGERFDLSTLKSHKKLLTPLDDYPSGSRYNLDGLVYYSNRRDNSSPYSYTQAFWNGSIEAVDTNLLSPELRGLDSAYIPSGNFEEALVGAVGRYRSAQELLGVEAPLVIMLSLLGVRGFHIEAPKRVMQVQRELHAEQPVIDRDDVIVPGTIADDFEFEPSAIMKNAFDAVWNAAGWPGSVYYDEDANWKLGKKRS